MSKLSIIGKGNSEKKYIGPRYCHGIKTDRNIINHEEHLPNHNIKLQKQYQHQLHEQMLQQKLKRKDEQQQQQQLHAPQTISSTRASLNRMYVPIRLKDISHLRKLGSYDCRCEICDKRVCSCLWSRVASNLIAAEQNIANWKNSAKVVTSPSTVPSVQTKAYNKERGCFTGMTMLSKMRKNIQKYKNLFTQTRPANKLSITWLLKPRNELWDSSTSLTTYRAANDASKACTNAVKRTQAKKCERRQRVSSARSDQGTRVNVAVTKSLMSKKNKEMFNEEHCHSLTSKSNQFQCYQIQFSKSKTSERRMPTAFSKQQTYKSLEALAANPELKWEKMVSGKQTDVTKTQQVAAKFSSRNSIASSNGSSNDSMKTEFNGSKMRLQDFDIIDDQEQQVTETIDREVVMRPSYTNVKPRVVQSQCSSLHSVASQCDRSNEKPKESKSTNVALRQINFKRSSLYGHRRHKTITKHKKKQQVATTEKSTNKLRQSKQNMKGIQKQQLISSIAGLDNKMQIINNNLSNRQFGVILKDASTEYEIQPCAEKNKQEQQQQQQQQQTINTVPTTVSNNELRTNTTTLENDFNNKSLHRNCCSCSNKSLVFETSNGDFTICYHKPVPIKADSQLLLHQRKKESKLNKRSSHQVNNNYYRYCRKVV